MNRSVMKRQMFNRGGAASFPDLTGDGKVTQKDILRGRGVQGFAMGGPPMMDPNMMPPAAPPPMAAPPMGAEQALAGAEAQGQEMGMMAAEGVMQQIDGAQDYQSLIDGIRGNQQPLEARYAELGSIVGQQDAMQTPESVLALTQPAIMMTEEGAVNSGIGELMQGIAGDTSMAGQMGEGVGGLMMAQSPEPAMEAPMMEAGNTPPVNFRQGGPVEVQRLQEGGDPSAIERAKELQPAYQAYLSGGYDAQARAAELEEQRKMSQAQMLFDIAQAGLQFAGTTEGGSIAERLANAAAASQLPQRIGERSAQMLAAKQAQTAEKRQLDMASRQAALQGAETEAAAQLKRDLAPAPKKLAPSMFRVTLKDGTSREFDVANDLAGFQAYIEKNADQNPQSVKVGEAAKSKFKVMPVYTFNQKGQLIDTTGYAVDESSGTGLAEYNAALKKAGAVSEKQAEHRFALNAKIKELDVSDTVATFRIVKDSTLLNGDKVVAGEVRALTSKDATALGKTGSIGPALGIQASLMEVYKAGEESKFILVDDNIEATLKKLGPGWSKTPPDKGLIKLQKVGTDGTVETKVLREDSSTFSSDLDDALADNFMPENEAASLALRDSVAKQVEKRLETTTINAEVREQADKLKIIAEEARIAANVQLGKDIFTAGQNAIQLAYDKERDAADLALRQVIEDRKLTDSKFDNIMAKAKFYDQKKQQEYSKSQDLIAQNNVKIDQAFKEREIAIAEGNFDLAKKKQTEVVRLNNLNANERDRQFILAQEAQALDERAQNELGTYRTDMLLQDSLRLKATVDHQAAMLALSQAEFDLKKAEPDIRVVGDFVMDFNTPDNRGVGVPVTNTSGEVVKARATTTTNINGTIIDTTDPTKPKIVYQDPRTKYEIVEGQFVDMSSGQPVPVMTIPKQGVFKEYNNKLYELIPGKEPREILKTGVPAPDFYDILMPDGSVAPADANTVNGRAVIDLALADGRKITRIGTTKTFSAQGFLSDVGVITSYDGRTFLDPKTGKQRLLTEVGAVRVSDQMIGQYKKVQGRSESALANLAKMDQVLIDNLLVDGSNVITDMSPEARAEFVKLNGLEGLSDAQIALKIKNGVRDAYQQARKGTGFWSNIAAGLDAVLGGPLASPELSNRLFGDITDARQFTLLTEILGRSALRLQVARPAYGETKELGTLFPNPNTLLSSPKTQANKLVSLGQQLRLEKRALLEIIANPQGTEKTLITKYQNKVNEIGRLQEMLGPVIGFGENPTEGNNAALSQEAVGPDGLTTTERLNKKRQLLEDARKAK
jgi:hypothetical protein